MNFTEKDKTSAKMTAKCLSPGYLYQLLQHSFSPSEPFAVPILLSRIFIDAHPLPAERELLLAAAPAYSCPPRRVRSANAAPQGHAHPARPFPRTAGTETRPATVGAGPGWKPPPRLPHTGGTEPGL